MLPIMTSQFNEKQICILQVTEKLFAEKGFDGTSIRDIAKAAKIYYPYLPINLVLKDRYDSIEKIQSITVPILIMHGKKDNIVPQKMGLELFEKANQPKFNYFPENDDHMMEYNDELLNNIKLFINKI